jgi:hypothetical protein
MQRHDPQGKRLCLIVPTAALAGRASPFEVAEALVGASQHGDVVWPSRLRVGAPYCFDMGASDPSGSTGTSTMSA